jgi:hypothetical protein
MPRPCLIVRAVAGSSCRGSKPAPLLRWNSVHDRLSVLDLGDRPADELE